MKSIKKTIVFISLLKLIFFLIITSDISHSQGIRIIDVTQEEDSIRIVYNLISSRAQDRFFVELEVSKNGGLQYPIYAKALEGDYGYGVGRGINKVLYWKPLDENIELIGNEFVFKLNATYLGSEAEMQFSTIKGSSFEMGDIFNDGEIDELPVHTVVLDDFEIGKYEVSNFQYAKFLNEYGADIVKSGEFKGEKMFYFQENTIIFSNNVWKAVEGYEYYPVTGVTWFGANEFCKFYGYRLPTEAEWEYTARICGKEVRYSSLVDTCSTDFFNFNNWFNFDSLKNNMNISLLTTETLGRYPPNDLGIFQMSGNVWEYCLDWYEWDYYSKSEEINPAGPYLGKYKVIRGGSFTSSQKGIRVFERSYISPDNFGIDIGFRVAKSIKLENKK